MIKFLISATFVLVFLFIFVLLGDFGHALGGHKGASAAVPR